MAVIEPIKQLKILCVIAYLFDDKMMLTVNEYHLNINRHIVGLQFVHLVIIRERQPRIFLE